MGEHRMWYLCVCVICIQSVIGSRALSTHEAEGESCIMSSGKRGICRKLPECLQVLRAVLQGDRRHTRCGFIGSVELVCCKMESSSSEDTFSTLKFRSSTSPPRGEFQVEYSTPGANVPLPYTENESSHNTYSLHSEGKEKVSTVKEVSVPNDSDGETNGELNLNNIESDIESIDSRIFLGNKNSKVFSPLFPLNALKNIVTGILVKPTSVPKISFVISTPIPTSTFHNSETQTEKYYEIPTTPFYNLANVPISSLKQKDNTPSTSLPLPSTSLPSILDLLPNEILHPETRPAKERNENPSLMWGEKYPSPTPISDMMEIRPPYYFPLKPSLLPEVTTRKIQISTSSWLDLESESPAPFGMNSIRPQGTSLPDSYHSPEVTTTEKTSTSEYGSPLEGKYIDETTVLNVPFQPTRTPVDNAWVDSINNPTTGRSNSITENPSISENWYPQIRPELETSPPQGSSYEKETRPETGIPSSSGSSSQNITTPSILRKSQQACAKYKQIPVLTKYIVGGDYAVHGEFPHMVALGFQRPRQSNLSWLCGGTILNDEFVLTAAHCVNTRYGAPLAARVGFTNLTADWSTGLEVAVGDSITHPGYDPIARAHDIALLRIASPLRFSQFVLPACLRTVAAPPPGQLIVTGWGSITPDGSTPTDLMKKGLVTPVEDAACRGSYPDVYRREMICAGGDDAVDTCKGDSGGPMQLLEPNSSIYAVVGVTSFGPNPCANSRPGVYTRVASYITWIENIVWPDFT